MSVTLQPVESRMASQAGYDAEAQELHVVFSNNDARGVYYGVPPAVGEAVMSASSFGKALHAMVIGQYTYRAA